MIQVRYLLATVAICAALGCQESGSESVDDTGLRGDTGEVDSDVAEHDANTPDTDSADTGASDTGTSADAYDPSECEPSYEAWQRHSKDIVDSYCTTCHAQDPQFGAPFPLLDYDALLSGEPGERKVDLMAEQLMARTMPPPSNPQLPHTDLDTLVEWATCGQQHPDHSIGLEASAPVWQAPPDPPAGTESFDVTADEFEIGVDTLDHYQCFVVDAPVDVDRFMKRFEPVVDDGRVVHHLLVSIDRDSTETRDSYRCTGFPSGDGYVYVWAPGQGPIEFEEGGLRIGPGDKFVLQIHYNNGAGAEDVRDSSGFRVYHDAPEGTEFGLASIGPYSIYVPANAPGRAESTCEVKRDVFIRASWPHMHEIGSTLKTSILRADGTEETLIDLTGWSFEAQIIYDTPTTVYPGDRLRTTCNYDNPYDFAVMFGEGTQDEMCFNFMYISPPADSPCQ
jgi:hypothetical protein